MRDGKPEVPNEDEDQAFTLRDMMRSPYTSGDDTFVTGECSDPVDEDPQVSGLSSFERAVHKSLTQGAADSTQPDAEGAGGELDAQYFQVGPDGNLYPTTSPTGGLLSQYVQMGGGTEELDEGIRFWKDYTTGPDRDEREINDRIRESNLINPMPADQSPDRPELLNHHLGYKQGKPFDNILRDDDADPIQEPGSHIVFDHDGRPTSIVDRDGTNWDIPAARPEVDRTLMGEDVGRDAGDYNRAVWGDPIGDKWYGYRPIGQDTEGAVTDKLSLYGGEVSIGDDRPTGKIREIPTTEELSIREIPTDNELKSPIDNRSPSKDLYSQGTLPIEDKPYS